MKIVALMWSVLIPAIASAQGFGIYEQGACAMSTGGARVAKPCEDGSAIYVNPAGLAGRKGLVVGLGGTLISGSGTFTGDLGSVTKLDTNPAVAPHGYLQYGMSDRMALGVGVYVPYGLGVKWPLDFGGRFVSYDSHLQTVYVQPTFAYAITDKVSIGGGLTVGFGSVELNRREDLANVPLGIVPGLTFEALLDRQTDFANTRLSASGAKGVGANVGVLVKANDRVRVGARYLTRMTLTYDGEATFAAVPASYRVTKPNPLGLPVGTPLDSSVSQVLSSLQDQSASTRIEMPAQFVVGVGVHASRRLEIFGDYQWVDWSAFKTVTLDFSKPIPPDEQLIQNYKDTSAVRLGVEFETGPSLRVRGGYFFNQAAAPDENVTPILPEARRSHLTAGLGWNFRRNMTLDLAYQFVRHSDRRGRIVNPAPGEEPTVSLNSGVYRARSDLLGITLVYSR